MSVRTNIIAKLAFVSAIANMADTTDWPEAVPLLQRAHDTVMIATEEWPLWVNDKEFNRIRKNITLFCEKMDWDYGRHNIQKMLNFALIIIDPIYANVKDDRKKRLIKAIADTLNETYYLFAGCDNAYPDYEVDIHEGLKASELWNEIWR